MSTKDKIIQTAALLLRKQGYHATGLNQIIRESGTPKGSLYYYFPNGKEELAIAAVEYISQRVIDQIEASFAYSDDPYVAVDHFMTNIIRGFMEQESERGIPIVLLAAESKPEHTKLHAACKQEMIRWQELVKEKLMNSGYDETKADERASLLHSMVIGGLSMTTALKQTTPLEHVKCYLRHLFMREE
ncbi:TetR/AcrR family transcriptional regulator [Bacillus altitudinis]|uniref:TetR/AcrR family transcriptional regulator n=1 Tax=Bacillus aerius TaxID=293388 RepID=A0AB39J0M7_9BACI|nr:MULTISPECIES: TetR/AcrR family transcriptional regulator [Bacillus]AMM87721.1 transcriptional regulator [Bacillus pumilus]MBR3206710.1 TetR/AcrR family transcriptional regulator [Bacillus sp. (in: firmicutes)]MBY0187345.1 TetR/AcrR family transcriptional regulator [Bacillus aerophilus]MDG3044671.1 TetR/AcrR family transcriptional regulator [Bacillus sp. B6(2022)]ANT55438.1 transcriptional regulator [Bacillus pumilus]